MSGKALKPGWLVYRLVIWSVVLAILLGACGNEVTNTPVANVPATTALPGPTPTPTIAFTSTPVPTPTPTEIPIVLPTATPPNPNLPSTALVYEPAFTQAPTYTPVPTDRPHPTDLPAPTVTPYVAPIVVPFSIYQKPLISAYDRLDYVLPPSFTTRCIAAKYFTSTVTFQPGSSSNAGALAPENQWIQDFVTRWYSDPRLNSFRLPAPTFTPYPTSTPIPTWTPIPSPTPLPYNTPDVFTGLTAAPPVPPTDTIGPTSTPLPTATPIVPTWTPSLVQRFQSTGSLTSNFIQSIFISDVTSTLNKFSTQPINFVLMWQVMNDLTLALVNVDTPIEVYLRAYESYLDQTITTILNRSLQDPRLAPTGSERYANRKIIIGNVPDLRSFSFFSPCFTKEKLQQVQNSYNAIINRVAQKYAGRVFVADLTGINWQGNPQWVAIEDGYDLTYAGSEAVADVFGKVFMTLKL